jgi:hypothetical protein
VGGLARGKRWSGWVSWGKRGSGWVSKGIEVEWVG